MVKIFASMQSMKHIATKDVIVSSEDKFPWAKQTQVSTLSLMSCVAEPETLFEFLGTFILLSEFEYTNEQHPPYPYPLHFYYSSFWVCKALHFYACSSLEKLTLRGYHNAGYHKLMGSLKSFVVLRVLDTDLEPLVGDSDDGYADLTDILPQSIKKVTLRHSPTAEEKFFAIVNSILGPGKRLLPNLEALAFRPTGASYPSQSSFRWIAACKSAGITLTFD